MKEQRPGQPTDIYVCDDLASSRKGMRPSKETTNGYNRSAD